VRKHCCCDYHDVSNCAYSWCKQRHNPTELIQRDPETWHYYSELIKSASFLRLLNSFKVPHRWLVFSLHQSCLVCWRKERQATFCVGSFHLSFFIIIVRLEQLDKQFVFDFYFFFF